MFCCLPPPPPPLRSSFRLWRMRHRSWTSSALLAWPTVAGLGNTSGDRRLGAIAPYYVRVLFPPPPHSCMLWLLGLCHALRRGVGPPATRSGMLLESRVVHKLNTQAHNCCILPGHSRRGMQLRCDVVRLLGFIRTFGSQPAFQQHGTAACAGPRLWPTPRHLNRGPSLSAAVHTAGCGC